MAGPSSYEAEAPPKAERSIAGLLTDLAHDAALLFHQEIALAKAEVLEKLGRLGNGIALLAIAFGFCFAGLLVLLAAAVFGLSLVVAPWLAALVVGGAVMAIGFVFALVGRQRLRSARFSTSLTMQSLRSDREWLKDPLR